MINGPGDQLLPGPALSHDQRGDVLRRDAAEARRLHTQLKELATELAGNAPLAQTGNKRVIAALLSSEGELAEEVEEELIELRRASFASQDMREGMRAFAEKRPAHWRGA